MRVLHLISSLKRGGMERQLCNVVTAPRLKNIDNKIIYFNNADFDYIDEYKIRHATHFIEKKFLNFNHLMKITKNYKPDLIISWSFKEAYLGFIISKIFKIKFLNLVAF